MNTSAIILAAGLSKRMGFPKAFLKFNEQQTFIEHLIEIYKSYGIHNIIVVFNSYSITYYAENNYNFLKDCILVTNAKPEKGRFYSLMLGCNALPFPTHTFIQNVDNPFTTVEILKLLQKERIKQSEISIPAFHGQNGHPILMHQRVIQQIKAIPETHCAQNLRSFIHQFKVRKVETEDEGILVNINSKPVYKKYFN